MLTTAKSIQLLDASGMNISPITDITSLYYETVCPTDDKVITRKYVYDGFPVGVNINSSINASIGTSMVSGQRDIKLYNSGTFYKIIDDNTQLDILVSNVSTSVILGTVLRQLNVTNYNLSKILTYYTPLDLMDVSVNNINSSIANINTTILDISIRVNALYNSLDISVGRLIDILKVAEDLFLIPNKFYLINDYYVREDGCMALPNNNNFSGPDLNSKLSLLVKANNASTLDGKLYEMYDYSGNALHTYGTYKLSRDSENNPLIQITYMKDQYGNEAPYDFYNLKYNGKYTFNMGSDASNLLLITNTVKNNIIKSNPFDLYKQIIISTSTNFTIYNNYIGVNSIINLDAPTSGTVLLYNNKIYNDCSIFIHNAGTITKLSNSIINNNNTINFNSVAGVNNNDNIVIDSSNIINSITYGIQNVIINSSNNISFYRNNSTCKNITILNNCDGSINLSDNIIVDNYVSSNILNTSSNSVYLFGQDVYAKSFNTLR